MPPGSKRRWPGGFRRRRFVREVGLSPKVFARIRRLRRACVDLIEGVGTADLSAGHGYADQPHFTRELRAMFDMSPQLLNRYLQQIRHVNLREHHDRNVQSDRRPV